MNKQLFSSFVGVGIIVVHIGLVLYILAFLSADPESGTSVLEIVLPFTVTYAIGVVKWVIDTQGHITSDKTVGNVYILIVSVIVISVLTSLCYGLYKFSTDLSFTATQLNWFFAGVESGFGAIFSLVFSDMFAKAEE